MGLQDTCCKCQERIFKFIPKYDIIINIHVVRVESKKYCF